MDNDMIEALEKLHSLKLSGALSEEEHSQMKAKVIEQGLSDSKTKALIMLDAGPQKISVIKRLREYNNADLKTAKDMVDNTPTVIEQEPGLDLDKLRVHLVELGAIVDWRAQ